MSRSMHVAANGIVSFILMDSSGFKVTLVWLPNFCFKNLLRIYIHEWQHATQSLETDLIRAKPWAINRLVSSLVTGEFLAVENLGNSCVTKASVQTSEHSWWWSAWPPFPRAILLCRGAREPRMPTCLLLPEGCADSCPHFTRKSQSRSSHSAKPPNAPSVPMASIIGARLLKPPDAEKRLPRHAMLKPQPVPCGWQVRKTELALVM